MRLGPEVVALAIKTLRPGATTMATAVREAARTEEKRRETRLRDAAVDEDIYFRDKRNSVGLKSADECHFTSNARSKATLTTHATMTMAMTTWMRTQLRVESEDKEEHHNGS